MHPGRQTRDDHPDKICTLMPNQSKERTLSIDEARSFYDLFGRKQDWQAFYENKALELLLEKANFPAAHAVFEFGCGTGRFAGRLLSDFLPAGARYLGIDVSSAMVRLAHTRLQRWPDRAEAQLSDGSMTIAEPDGSFDRFVSNYVLDLLSRDQIFSLLTEARRVLTPNSRLCLVSLTHGKDGLPRLLSRLWQRVQASHPKLVGGCRPIELLDFVTEPRWHVEYLERVCSFGVSSEVLIASPSHKELVA